MKKTILALLVLVTATAFTQSLVPVEKGAYVKQWATYVNATTDTTGWISAIGSKGIADLKEVGLIFTATDSLQAAVYVLAKNSKLTVGGVTAVSFTYTDSISSIGFGVNGHSAFASTPYYKVIMLKDSKTNAIQGADAIKIGIDFTAASSNRAGRVCKVYLWGKE